MTTTSRAPARTARILCFAFILAGLGLGPASAAGDEAPPPGTAAIALTKLTNGVRYDAAPGARVAVDSDVEWTYTVTNVGASALRLDSLVDAWASSGGAGSIEVDITPPPPPEPWYVDDPGAPAQEGEEASADESPAAGFGSVAPPASALVLEPGDTAVFIDTATAIVGGYTNTATITATPVGDDGAELGPAVEASAVSFYTAGDAGLTVTSTVQGRAAPYAPGAGAAVGAEVTWTHTVTNAGTVELTDVTLEQSQSAGSQDSAIASQTWPSLGPGESVAATTSAPAVRGQASSATTVHAASSLGEVTSADMTWYYGGTPAYDVVVAINGQTNDAAPGQTLAADADAELTVTVRNTGETYLDRFDARIAVVTGGGAPVDAPLAGPTGALAPGASRTFSLTHRPPIGESLITATVAAVAVDGHGAQLQQQPTAAAARTWFTAGSSGLAIVATVNGGAYPSAPGLSVPVDSELTWSFEVTNTGTLPLTGVSVTGLPEVVDAPADAPAPAPRDPVAIGTIESLLPGQTQTVMTTSRAQAGHIRATATATAVNPQGGATLTASDTTYYTGGVPALGVVKELAVGGTGSFGTEVEAGLDDPVTWRVTVTNGGEASVSDVVVVDATLRESARTEHLAPGESFVAEWESTGEEVLAQGKPGEESITAESVTEIVNEATVTALGPDGTEFTAAATATLVFAAQAEPEPDPELPSTQTRGHAISLVGWLVIGAIVLGAAAAGIWFYRKGHRSEDGDAAGAAGVGGDGPGGTGVSGGAESDDPATR